MGSSLITKVSQPIIGYIIKHPHIIIEGALGTVIVALLLGKKRDCVTYEEKLQLYQKVIRQQDMEIADAKDCIKDNEQLKKINSVLIEILNTSLNNSCS